MDCSSSRHTFSESLVNVEGSPPLFLFEPACGVFSVLGHFEHSPELAKWMSLRLEADFALLYGLRNKVVHTGVRQFSLEVAGYLGQTAVEVVLTVMNARFKNEARIQAIAKDIG